MSGGTTSRPAATMDPTFYRSPADAIRAPREELAYVVALDRAGERLPGIDRSAMAMVLLLHRVASAIVYDLESTVHRPAGWSWSAFRMLFTLWICGPQEAGRCAELAGMSRAAVSSLVPGPMRTQTWS